MCNKSPGMSLVEVLIAVALTGILAIYAVPKMLSTPNTNSSTMGQVDLVMQQVALTLEVYQALQGKTVDLQAVSLDSLFYDYGNFFAYKGVSGAQYFLLHDGSRLTTNPGIYAGAYPVPFPEYGATGLTNTLLRDPDYAAAPTAEGDELTNGYCGDYTSTYSTSSPYTALVPRTWSDENQCLYLDVNGKKPPNQIGKTGDIIPIRIDPANGRIRTLYQWHVEDGRAAVIACRFVSSYDIYADAPGASACP